MGFDKPDLGFVVHLGAPASPVAYYQQVGRAGRATERADVLLLPASEDREIWRYFATASMPRRADADAVLTALAESSPKPMSTAALETVADVRRTRLELLLKVLDVEGAVRRVSGGWASTGAGWTYDEERYGARRGGPRRRGRVDARLPAHRRLPDALPAGGAGRPRRRRLRPLRPVRRRLVRRHGARRRRAGGDPHAAQGRGARSSRGRSGRAACPVSGSRCPAASAPDERLDEGRVVARLTDLGWGQRLRALLAAGAPDAPADDRLLAACVEVLAGWDWAQRPVAVAAVPSLRPAAAGGLGGPAPRRARPADRPRHPRRSRPTSPPAVPAATARSGWPRCTTGSRCPRRLAAGLAALTGRCCSSTTWSTPAGPSPWRVRC